MFLQMYFPIIREEIEDYSGTYKMTLFTGNDDALICKCPHLNIVIYLVITTANIIQGHAKQSALFINIQDRTIYQENVSQTNLHTI